MNRNFKVLVAGRDKQELNALERILSEKTDYSIELSLASNGHFDPLHDIHPLPDLLILCLSDAWKEELQELSERSSSDRPPVIVIANADDETQAMRQAMRAGARDLFTRPVNTDQIVDAINHVSQEKFTQSSSEGPVLTAVVNAKGGSGATLLAANLAHVLAKEGKQKVALIDMDLQFGTLGLYLDIHPSMGIVEVLEYSHELDAVALKAYMTEHESGVYMLAATQNSVVLPREIDLDKLSNLINTLQTSFDHIIVDLPRQIDAVTTTILERANNVVITTQQSLTHLRDTIRLKSILKNELGIRDKRLMVVVNRYDSNDAITLADINKMLQDCPISLVPNDYKRVTENINLGIPLYKQSRHSAITKAIIKLASKLSNSDITAEKGGVFTRMFGRFQKDRRLDA
jgi:pilus assembly protein CpaE